MRREVLGTKGAPSLLSPTEAHPHQSQIVPAPPAAHQKLCTARYSYQRAPLVSVARFSGLSRSEVKALVYQATTPRTGAPHAPRPTQPRYYPLLPHNGGLRAKTCQDSGVLVCSNAYPNLSLSPPTLSST